jgi:hypothetical protein
MDDFQDEDEEIPESPVSGKPAECDSAECKCNGTECLAPKVPETESPEEDPATF